MIDNDIQNCLNRLPKVDKIVNTALSDDFFKNIPKTLFVNSIRNILEKYREKILSRDFKSEDIEISESVILSELKKEIKIKTTPNLSNVINATGIVIHTNLGRSLLAESAIEHIISAAGRYSNLEYDIKKGKRGSRYSIVEDLLCEISGAEASIVVNNNAAAVILCLDTISK